MTEFANKSFMNRAKGEGSFTRFVDNWDQTFKKPSKVEQYVELARELVRIRDEHARDWEAREDLQLTAMNQLFESMTPEEQAECVAASLRAGKAE